MANDNLANQDSTPWLSGHSGSRLRTEVGARLLVITLDHYPVNSLDSIAYQELLAVFSQLAGQTNLSAVLLRGDNRCFSAGQDRRDAPDRDTNADSHLAVAANALVAATLCPVPLVVALKSAAIGAGLILAACADVLVLDSEATLTLPERKFGVIAGHAHLAQWVGAGGAALAVLTGEPINPRAFIHGGAIVISHAEVDSEAERVAQSIAESNPALMQSTKFGWLDSRKVLARDYATEMQRTISLGLMDFSPPMSLEKRPDA